MHGHGRQQQGGGGGGSGGATLTPQVAPAVIWMAGRRTLSLSWIVLGSLLADLLSLFVAALCSLCAWPLLAMLCAQ